MLMLLLDYFTCVAVQVLLMLSSSVSCDSFFVLSGANGHDHRILPFDSTIWVLFGI